MEKRQRQFISSTLFTILGRFGGVVLPFLIAYYYGSGKDSDAFFFAYGLILSLTGLFAPIFESLLVPYLAEVKDSAAKVSSLANGVLIFNLPILFFLGFVIWAGLDPALTHWSGMNSETAHLTSKLFFQMLPMLFLGVLSALSNSIFYTHKIFWFPAVSPLIRSLCVIGTLVATHALFGIYAASGGFAVGEIFRWILGIFLLVKLSKWKFSVDWKESREKVKSFMGQSIYQLFALLALNLIPLSDQWFASWLGTGNLSLICYADRLFQIPFQLMMTGFLQVFLSYWSESYYQDSPAIFWKKARKDIRTVFIVTVVFSGMLILLREPLVYLVFGFGDMTQGDLKTLGVLFGWLMVGFAAAILNLLYVRILFVLKKSNVFLVQSLIRFALNIILNFVLMRFWGLEGLAISTSGVFVVTTLWLHFYLKRAWKAQEAA